MKATHCESHTSKENPCNTPSRPHLCNSRSGMKQSHQTGGDKNKTRTGRVCGASLEYAREEYVSYFSLAWHIRRQEKHINIFNRHTKRRQQLDEQGVNRPQAQSSRTGE